MILVDTNILSRMAQKDHSMHSLAMAAVNALHQQGNKLAVVPQCFYEFYAMATRPQKDNGLGILPKQARSLIEQFKITFQFLPDPPDIYTTWEHLVTHHQVSGKPAHDARLVAAMSVHGINEILTFNLDDFKRFPIQVIDPRHLLPPTGVTVIVQPPRQ